MSRATTRAMFILLGGAMPAWQPPPSNECADYSAPHHLSANQDLSEALVRVSNSAANVNLCEARMYIQGAYPPAVTGVPYDESINVVGVYASPLSVDVAGGSLPVGLALEATGNSLRLYGTPVGDLTINGVLPAAVTGVPYSERLQVEESVGVVTIDIITGSLPGWMQVAWHSGTNEIEFYGTPT